LRIESRAVSIAEDTASWVNDLSIVLLYTYLGSLNMSSQEESPEIKNVNELLIKDYTVLENLYKQDEKLFDRITAVVKEWLEDYTAGASVLGAKLMMLLGEEAGRIIYNLLLSSPITVIDTLSFLDKVSSNRNLLAELRELAAKFHYPIYVKLEKQRNPDRVLQMYLSVNNEDPLMVRIEAILFNGNRVALELDEDDIKNLIREVVAKRITLVMEILAQEARKTDDETENISGKVEQLLKLFQDVTQARTPMHI